MRQRLSRLKNSLISRDLQDIYRYKPGERELTPKDEGDFARADISYQIHDSIEVLAIIERIHPMNEQGRRFARARLEAGDKAVIGTCNEMPVFYGWLMFDEIEMTYGVFLDVPRGIAFGYNLFTTQSCRRCGAMTGFYRFACLYLKQNHMHTLYVGIATNNTTSIEAHEKNGFVKTGYFYTLKLLGTSFTLARFEHAKRFYMSF